jgi:hypothetical protein
MSAIAQCGNDEPAPPDWSPPLGLVVVARALPCAREDEAAAEAEADANDAVDDIEARTESG